MSHIIPYILPSTLKTIFSQQMESPQQYDPIGEKHICINCINAIQIRLEIGGFSRFR
jgi:hypothetical protein